MNNNKDFIQGNVSQFTWLNEPPKYSFSEGLIIQTKPHTDFWQRTHYGFRRDDGHCYLTEMTGDFSFMAHLTFDSKMLYDQCGIILRTDDNNWVKASVEYENEHISRLGSVVTNLGYSDWATTDISTEVNSMWYKFNKKGQDVLIESSADGLKWKQMRILHLHKDSKKVKVGIYACRPLNSSFECKVFHILVGENTWQYES